MCTKAPMIISCLSELTCDDHHPINRVQHSLKQAELPTPAKDGISFVQVYIFQQYFKTPAGGAELTATQMSEHF